MKRTIFAVMACSASVAMADSIAIPMLERSPVKVDGVVSPGEYARATIIEGMQSHVTHRMIPRDVEIQVLSTPEELFVLMRTPVEESDTGGGLLAVATQDGDAKVCRDDDVEFLVASGDGKAVYHVLFNSRNARFELALADGARVEGWKSGAREAGRVVDGTWTVEVALPWKSLKGVSPASFSFNVARNFVRSGLGYGNLTGQKDIHDAKAMIRVNAVENFDGFRFLGLDARSLASGRLRVRRDGGEAGGETTITLSSYAGPQKKVVLNELKVGEAVDVPQDEKLKYVLVNVKNPRIGSWPYRRIMRFETGVAPEGGPVSGKRKVPGLNGCSYVRFYPGANKVSVYFEGIGRDAKAPSVEVKSPDGMAFRGTLEFKPSSGAWSGIVALPPEASRKPGKWEGALVLGGRRYENAFGFEERKFPWQGNKLGISNKILPPFTPIETDGTTLSTVLRRHTLGKDGLLAQVESGGKEVFSAPMRFELSSGGKTHVASGARLDVFERLPFRVRSEARAKFGDWTYIATNIWDYDGFSLMQVRFIPPPGAQSATRLTLKTTFKENEARLFHAMVDMPRGNPAGAIPSGSGKVWDSSSVPRRPGKNGMPVFPGEFTPYLWLGGEERGMCFAFDSPRGFDLEDGKPMIRLVRAPGVVTAECDIVNRDSGKPHPIVFSFAYQATPVKPKPEGWRKWSFHAGERFPGLLHVCPCARAESFGIFPVHFAKVPFSNDYTYAKAYCTAMRQRKAPYGLLEYFRTNHLDAVRTWAKGHETYLNGSSKKGVGMMLSNLERMLGDNFTVNALTVDRALPYTCPSIIPVDDEAYQYYKAEWTTFRPYNEGVNERVFLRPSYVDYLVWTYDKLLEAGADGIYFDEMYIIGQTNPDLSPVRDYKRRLVPETGFFAMRSLAKRVAHITHRRKNGEQFECIHYTNMLLIPAFSFTTLGLCWEYHVEGNFQNQFKTDYMRALSTGRQAGLVTIPLLLPHIRDRAKMKPFEYLDVKDRFLRTGLGLAIQHEMFPYRSYWGRYDEQYRCRYVPWAFGTHLDDCTFTPYWEEDKPFSASGDFLVGAYRRGKCMLMMLSNLGAEAESEVVVDTKRVGLSPDAVLMDATTGERFPLGRAKIKVAECDFRWLYAGPPEFGATLKPPRADAGYMR